MTGRRHWVPWMLLGMLSIAAFPARATVEVSASLDRPRAEVGSQVVLTVEVSGEVRDVVPPQIPEILGLEAFGGGQSQRFSFVNGQVSASHSFTFYLQPRSEGRYTIPRLEIWADGKRFETSELQLEVVAATVTAPGGAAPTRARDAAGPSASAPSDAFVTLTVDTDSVVVGEQVVLTFRFYNARRLSAFDSPQYSPPRTEGFWREDLRPSRHYTQVLQSRRYQVEEINYALFPTRAGDLEIGEATLQIPEDAFGVFRSRRQSSGPRLLRTKGLTIHVDPLPQPEPSDFSGAVASGLRLGASVDRREVDQGDALSLTVRLEGAGHLSGLEPPRPVEAPGLRYHDAGQSVESLARDGRLQGVRVLEYLVIPQDPGIVELPGLRYVYFDTGQDRYVTLSTEPIELRVRAAEGHTESVFAGGRKAEIELLARDILHIADLPAAAAPWPGPLPERVEFWLLLAGPGLAWAVSGLLARRRAAWLADPRRRRWLRARSSAERALGGVGRPSERVQRALEGYVADRFDRSASGITRDETERLFTARAVPATLARAWMDLLDACEAARYAGASADDEALVERARTLLAQMEEATRA